MEKELESTLKKLEEYLIKIDAPILNKLNPGVTKIKKELNNPKVKLPTDVEVLYKWKNGIKANSKDTIGNLSLFLMGIFISYEKAKSINTEMWNKEYGWGSDMFPLFESGGGEYFLIDCNPESLSYRMIFLHSIDAVEFDTVISQFDNLNCLFQTVHECFVESACFYDMNSELDFNYEEVFRISKKINVRSKYWKLF